MECGIEKCAMIIIRNGKRQMPPGIELPYQNIFKTRRKGNLQVLGNIGSGHHQTNRDERKTNLKEYL